MILMNNDFGAPQKAGRFGVEVELEATNDIPWPEVPYWRMDMDGSLRGHSIEYVMTTPADYNQALYCVKQLYEYLSDRKLKLRDTIRTGVHVHLNVQDYSYIRFFNLITLYYMFEVFMQSYCNNNRQGNLFCLRAVDAEQIIPCVLRSIAKKRSPNWGHMVQDTTRYAALNYTSLPKYCSVEFRALQSPQNSRPIKDWISLIEKLHIASENFDRPADIVYSVSEGNWGEFCRRIFGDKFYYLLCEKCNKYGYDMYEIGRQGIELAQLIALHPDVDWNAFANIKKKSKGS